jgi:hypothetical protein
MKVHLIRIAVIVLAVIGPLSATPVAARPKDPDSFLVTSGQQGKCSFSASFGDPLAGLCPAGSPEVATNQPVSQRPAEARGLLRNAVDAVTSAGALQYTLEMRTMTTTVSGGLWMAQSTFVGDYAAPDTLRGALTLASP